MKSNAKNVKMGVCSPIFGGQDLGLTKGGVEVTVTTNTQKVTVDQYGETPLSELITGREVKAKVPLAETDIERMVAIMPGAVLEQMGGIKASGTVTFATNPTADKTIIINGKVMTFKAAPAADGEVKLGADVGATTANLAAALNASSNTAVAQATYSAAAGVLTVTSTDYGVSGNAFTLAVGTSGATVSGATLTGGKESTAKRVIVPHAVSTDLRPLAKELRLRPQGAVDGRDDFTIFLAMTPGALNFAYMLDKQRVYDVEFTGFPDTDNDGRLFAVGDTQFAAT
ncbi:hypothetical protein [Cupriavidus metallidurans]|uniref:hypothetical protein n=1 Tax=Cupriavidus metallidurans TaxID=119219 RepID=UPI001CCD5EC8|nr:hypothetical protein [Cupriavidus metallidurans]UBM12758.1 hypothetical protein LAI70_27790 [Cupriavidus metallidurans]